MVRCPKCERRFGTDAALDDHMAAKHERRAPEPASAIIEPTCIECGTLATLVGGERIYPHRPDLYAKRFWLCECGAYCGCHGLTTRPLGYPCGPLTRAARSNAHTAFDPLWRSGSMSRRQAYTWLAKRLGITPEACHIGMMDRETARRVVEIVQAREAA